MLKLRLRFVDDEAGRKELDEALEKIENDFKVISKSKEYRDGRGSKYSRIYIEVKNR